MRYRTAVLLGACGACLALSLASGCSAAAKEPKLEDEARLLAPIPACVIPLSARKGPGGTLRNLREEQYWQVVFPAYDADKHALPEGATTCTGYDVFADQSFKGTRRIHAYPEAVTEEDILIGSGGEHLKAVWLKTHVTEDGLDAGVLALVRAKESVAEVYAVTPFRAATPRPYFVIERMGNDVLVTAQDNACQGIKAGVPCENDLTLYIPRKGHLVDLGTFPLERRAFVSAAEPGTFGDRVEYRLTSSVSYQKTGVKSYEQVIAYGDEGRVLRRAEIERVFAYREIELFTTEDPLWPRIFPKAK